MPNPDAPAAAPLPRAYTSTPVSVHRIARDGERAITVTVTGRSADAVVAESIARGALLND